VSLGEFIVGAIAGHEENVRALGFLVTFREANSTECSTVYRCGTAAGYQPTPGGTVSM
jgi:hypothetical protein